MRGRRLQKKLGHQTVWGKRAIIGNLGKVPSMDAGDVRKKAYFMMNTRRGDNGGWGKENHHRRDKLVEIRQ